MGRFVSEDDRFEFQGIVDRAAAVEIDETEVTEWADVFGVQSLVMLIEDLEIERQTRS